MIFLLACTPEPDTANGTFVDARGGTIPNAELVFTASKPECAPKRATTDAEGAWQVDDLCGQASWTVAPADPLWFVPTPPAAAPGTELRAWRAPESEGVYLIDGTNITTLTTHSVLDAAPVFGTTELVRFPVEIPGELPRIDGTRALLIVGADPALSFAPLVPSERRVFGSKEAPRPVDPWVYLGVRFTDDTTHEPVVATVRPEGVTTVEGPDESPENRGRIPVAEEEPPTESGASRGYPGSAEGFPRASGEGQRPRALRYVNGTALPAGRYALPTTDGARAWLLDFGPATP